MTEFHLKNYNKSLIEYNVTIDSTNTQISHFINKQCVSFENKKFGEKLIETTYITTFYGNNSIEMLSHHFGKIMKILKT